MFSGTYLEERTAFIEHSFTYAVLAVEVFLSDSLGQEAGLSVYTVIAVGFRR